MFNILIEDYNLGISNSQLCRDGAGQDWIELHQLQDAGVGTSTLYMLITSYPLLVGRPPRSVACSFRPMTKKKSRKEVCSSKIKRSCRPVQIGKTPEKDKSLDAKTRDLVTSILLSLGVQRSMDCQRVFYFHLIHKCQSRNHM